MADNERTTCLVVGGGPAGMVLGLLLARAGVEVTVLEKHGDFLRDFRGDTVHASTIRLLDELGLGEEFRKLPQSRLETVAFPGPDGKIVTLGEISRLRPPYNYIATVPQWDFLDLLVDAAKQEPTFSLRMNTAATGLIKENGRVAGVRYRTSGGETGTIRADLTVACDGRTSLLRDEAGLAPKEFPVPFDVWWFRLPRHEQGGPVSGISPRIKGSELLLTINRDDYFQVAYFLKKGTNDALRAEGIPRFRERIVNLAPDLADAVDTLTDWNQVPMLDVRLNRLHRWHTDGLLLIGDAAHAMSPVGGVGINVAVQDAVATATLLAEPLRQHRVGAADLARIRRRRWFPTVVTQTLQRVIQRVLVGPVLRGEITSFPKAPIFLTRHIPALRAIPAYIVAIGPRPEHAPDFARRP
ncbi:MAG TPA: FAD-dependent oxidoreductase [Actinophytocola sp.]|jgi:2-polyprenyl-6-methoxyphenol hydroxylase-like FAD-dependent oxidoreductase|uniref:FAD-dependent oxidoreductase n=1 Tax=Actinophytocola sp. TaxID=1872138 RepID=UPI002DFFA912|nr:FAD-dependent oxidoreductase [Actinophytocola sp.]